MSTHEDHCIDVMSRALELLREKEPDGCACGAFIRPIIAQLERAIADRRADRDPPAEQPGEPLPSITQFQEGRTGTSAGDPRGAASPEKPHVPPAAPSGFEIETPVDNLHLMLMAQSTARLNRVRQLEQVVRAFLEKWEAIERDEKYRYVWLCHQMHNGPYTGLTGIEETAAMRSALGLEVMKAGGAT